MATVAPILETPPNGADMPVGVLVYKWAACASGDTLSPLPVPWFSDCAVQVSRDATPGTYGNGVVSIKGTLSTQAVPTANETVILTTPGGAQLALSSDRVEQILQRVYQIIPSFSGTTGSHIDIRVLLSTSARR